MAPAIADAMQEAELLDSVAGGELQVQDDRVRRRGADQRLELVPRRVTACAVQPRPLATVAMNCAIDFVIVQNDKMHVRSRLSQGSVQHLRVIHRFRHQPTGVSPHNSAATSGSQLTASDPVIANCLGQRWPTRPERNKPYRPSALPCMAGLSQGLSRPSVEAEATTDEPGQARPCIKVTHAGTRFLVGSGGDYSPGKVRDGRDCARNDRQREATVDRAGRHGRAKP